MNSASIWFWHNKGVKLLFHLQMRDASFKLFDPNNLSLLGVCRMNHDAKHTSGIFRRRPSTSSNSSRLGIQPSYSGGSISCPVSPRHTKHLPVVPTLPSSQYFNDVLSSTSPNFRDGPRIHRSPSASNTYNYRQQSSGNLYSYTGGFYDSI